MSRAEVDEPHWMGVISDTHGLLRPEALAALAGCAHIIHAGDVGPEAVLAELERIAPVTIVRGNVDREAWAERLPQDARVPFAGETVYVLHDLHDLRFDPAADGVAVVVSGHSHKPLIEERGGVLYLNPGSAGRRRFKLPITLARLKRGPEGFEAELVKLVD